MKKIRYSFPPFLLVIFFTFKGLYTELESGLTKIPEIADVGEPGTQCLLPIFLPKRPRIDIIHGYSDNTPGERLFLQTVRTPASRHRLLDQYTAEASSSLFHESDTPLLRYSEYRRVNSRPTLTERFGYNENARASYEEEDEN